MNLLNLQNLKKGEKTVAINLSHVFIVLYRFVSSHVASEKIEKVFGQDGSWENKPL